MSGSTYTGWFNTNVVFHFRAKNRILCLQLKIWGNFNLKLKKKYKKNNMHKKCAAPHILRLITPVSSSRFKFMKITIIERVISMLSLLIWIMQKRSLHCPTLLYPTLGMQNGRVMTLAFSFINFVLNLWNLPFQAVYLQDGQTNCFESVGTRKGSRKKKKFFS